MTHERPKGVMRNLALALTVAAAPVLGSGAAAQDMTEVRMAVSGTSFLDISYFPVLLPKILGYWEEDGYDVDIFTISGSSEAAQQLAADNLDFAQMAGASIIIANGEFDVPIRTLITNFALGWGLAVPTDSDIETAADLKSKNIGIVSVSTGGVSLVKSFVSKAGLDPDSDISIIATGVGAQPLLALQNDQVQALMYWSSALVGFQNNDPNLRIIKDPDWAELPDYSFATSQQKIEESPEMVEAISRGVAKAMVFATANPDCVRQLQWEYYPDSKPSNVDEETAAAWDLAKVEILLADQANASKLLPEGMVAGASAEAMSDYQDFLVSFDILDDKAEPSELVPENNEEFIRKINDFDHEAVKQAAMACEF